jgi:hypothetical protein
MAAKRSSNALKWEFDSGLRRDVWRVISRLRAAAGEQSSGKKKAKSTKALYRKMSRKK